MPNSKDLCSRLSYSIWIADRSHSQIFDRTYMFDKNSYLGKRNSKCRRRRCWTTRRIPSKCCQRISPQRPRPVRRLPAGGPWSVTRERQRLGPYLQQYHRDDDPRVSVEEAMLQDDHTILSHTIDAISGHKAVKLSQGCGLHSRAWPRRLPRGWSWSPSEYSSSTATSSSSWGSFRSTPLEPSESSRKDDGLQLGPIHIISGMS